MLQSTAVLTADEVAERIHAVQTPALLMLVAHVTGDAAALREQWRPDPACLPASGLPPEVDDEARAWCLAQLEPLLATASQWPVRPDPQLLAAIGEWAIGAEAAQVPRLLEAALVPDDTDPRAPDWTARQIAPDRTLTVSIIGTGISGLLVALRCKQAGVPFTIFEKNDSVGGTWWENTYPDCRTDVHSHIYTYSFFAHDWPSYFSRQAVILDYLRRFAAENGLLDHVEFGTEVRAAAWDERRNVWRIQVTGPDGDREVTSAVLVSAVGQLNRPSIPKIEGLETFSGPAFHSARWDPSVDLTGKRVAVIGTGASALQFAPALSRSVDRLLIFQRSAPWLMPTPELRRDVDEDERVLLRELPMLRAYYRFSIFLPRVIGQLAAATVDPDYPPTEYAVSAANEQLRVMLTEYLRTQAGDRTDLFEKVLPDYPPGAKRIVRDDGTWLRTLKQDNVDLLTDAVVRVDEHGVWTRSGDYFEVDAIVFGTGFAAADFLTPMRVTGTGGKDLHRTWGIDACAYMGLTLPDFPNLFCMYGPNTNLVLHGNLVFFMECQAAYIADALRLLLETGSAAMDLRAETFQNYRAEVTEASALRAWGWSKTHSWYMNAEGRSTIMWPLTAQRYFDGTASVRPEDYRLS